MGLAPERRTLGTWVGVAGSALCDAGDVTSRRPQRRVGPESSVVRRARVTVGSSGGRRKDLAAWLASMNAQVLIDSIVRQVTVLIAQLATSGGIRAPLSHVANQVFLDLARELEEQGLSRKVSADMFGMALRAYIRKVRRLSEAETEKGRTLWQALLDFVASEGIVTRERVIERFAATAAAPRDRTL